MEPTQQYVEEAVEHLSNVLNEDGDLHYLIAQATQAELGDPNSPLDGLYWTTYKSILTKVLIGATYQVPIS